MLSRQGLEETPEDNFALPDSSARGLPEWHDADFVSVFFRLMKNDRKGWPMLVELTAADTFEDLYAKMDACCRAHWVKKRIGSGLISSQSAILSPTIVLVLALNDYLAATPAASGLLMHWWGTAGDARMPAYYHMRSFGAAERALYAGGVPPIDKLKITSASLRWPVDR
ncbi:hypothetical protein LTR17_022025 [Elasticomyces elasticus]|nr:hypothetical protein LTR17_022025 [Elasticomyces elasticus]